VGNAAGAKRSGIQKKSASIFAVTIKGEFCISSIRSSRTSDPVNPLLFVFRRRFAHRHIFIECRFGDAQRFNNRFYFQFWIGLCRAEMFINYSIY
jgi:hypothetical protein